jgi:hypothetical protein
MTTLRRSLLPVLVLVSLTLGGCASAAAPSTAPTASTPPAAAVPAPSAPGTGGTTPADPGPSADPNGAVATDAPIDSGDGSILQPDGRIVVPKPGQLDVRPIAAQTLSAKVDGRRVIVSVAYTSGVEPCNVLDSIIVETGPSTFEITLFEGHGPGDFACIEIAEFKQAIVDLGELAPGTYTISDGAGGAAPITVTVA